MKRLLPIKSWSDEAFHPNAKLKQKTVSRPHRSMARTLGVLTLLGSQPFLFGTCRIPNLPDSEPFWFGTCLIPNLPDSESDWFRIWLTLNMPDSGPIWLSDSEMWSQNYLIPILSDCEPYDSKPIWYWTNQIPKLRPVRGQPLCVPLSLQSCDDRQTLLTHPVAKLATKQVNPSSLSPYQPWWPQTFPSTSCGETGDQTGQPQPPPPPSQLTKTTNPS